MPYVSLAITGRTLWEPNLKQFRERQRWLLERGHPSGGRCASLYLRHVADHLPCWQGGCRLCYLRRRLLPLVTLWPISPP